MTEKLCKPRTEKQLLSTRGTAVQIGAPGQQPPAFTHTELVPTSSFWALFILDPSQSAKGQPRSWGTQIWGSRTCRLPVTVLSHWPGWSWGAGST